MYIIKLEKNIYNIIVILVFIEFILLTLKLNYNYFFNVIIIRYHIFTSSQANRFNKWRKNIKTNYLFIYLTDSNCDRNNNKTLTYCITEQEVLINYPSLKKIKRYRMKNESFYMWAFHLEHIMLCIKRLNKKYIFKYAWILEQDIGYSGNINDLFQKYENNTSDLITSKYYISNKGWYFCCNNEYMKYRLKKLNGRGFKTNEHIQRWSMRYIKNVMYLFKKNLHSQSEYASIEFVLFSNLKYQRIYSNDVGYKFRWNSNITQSEWVVILNNSTYQNKIYHALKF